MYVLPYCSLVVGASFGPLWAEPQLAKWSKWNSGGEQQQDFNPGVNPSDLWLDLRI
jgi:hypothetical protein